jgi:hypothetical protein
MTTIHMEALLTQAMRFWQGIVFHEYIIEGVTVNKGEVQDAHPSVRGIRPEDS